MKLQVNSDPIYKRERGLEFQKHFFYLHDFCSLCEEEAISEDGLDLMFQHVATMTKRGWSLLGCCRDENDACVIEISYQK
jgi:hypothetical protein